MRKFKIITLGCKVNQCESAYIYEQLIKAKWKEASDKERADLVIINTCIVTQKASRQSRQQIRKAIRENPLAHIIVTGCYAQVYPEELLNIEGISLIVGNKEKSQIPKLIKNGFSDKLIVYEFSKNEPFVNMTPTRFFNRSRAFLKIQDGCESYCSYCIVPYARGPLRSMRIEDVIDAIKQFADRGYKEVVLTGIHLGKYGIERGESLEMLLKEIVKKRFPLRIRLSSIEPNEVTDELLELISCENICKHLHIPLQSGDNRILRYMNRNYTREEFEELIMKIYKKNPYIAIGTDVIVGFPGEDSVAYKNTLSLLKRLPISYLHVFSYSDRPKTKAFYMKEKIPGAVVKERVKELRQLSKKKRAEFIKRCIGKVFDIIVESSKDGFLEGLSDNYIRVLIPKKTSELLLRVKIEDIKEEFAIGSINKQLQL